MTGVGLNGTDQRFDLTRQLTTADERGDTFAHERLQLLFPAKVCKSPIPFAECSRETLLD